METRANYILVGLFTLLSILGTLAFFIWLASVQINTQYETYDILFEDVSGLDSSGDVHFNGITVGRVIGMQIAPQNPSRVLVSIEVEADTPVRADTVAQLQSQGVTGVAFVSLSGGTPAAAPLIPDAEGRRIIPSRRSTVQTLVKDAPDLLTETLALLGQLQVLTGPENQAYVTNVLRNLDASSGRLDQALTDLSKITGTVQEATSQITEFTARLDIIGENVARTLENSDTTLQAATEAFQEARETFESSGQASLRIEETFAEARALLQDQVPELLATAAEVATSAGKTLEELRQQSTTTLEDFGGTAELLNNRLTELEVTLREANTAFLAVTEASDSFDRLVDGDGKLLVAEARVVLAEARETIAAIRTTVAQDVPDIVADIRAAMAEMRGAIDIVSATVDSVSDQIAPLFTDTRAAITSANGFLTDAREGLAMLEQALDVTRRTLQTAETTFSTATGVMQTDLEPMIRDIRRASEEITQAITEVAADMPQITEELRAVIARSNAVVTQVQRTVSASAPGIADFTSTGLPELTRLSSEARGLVSAMRALTQRIEGDPARFLLDGRVPDYRR